MATVILLLISNTFMTFAWYGHLKRRSMGMVAANRLGYGRFNGYQLKIIQEAITLVVFAVFAYFYLGESFRWNYAVSFVLVMAAVAFAFWGRT
jgi:uncharacterized protein (DUF486 family)